MGHSFELRLCKALTSVFKRSHRLTTREWVKLECFVTSIKKACFLTLSINPSQEARLFAIDILHTLESIKFWAYFAVYFPFFYSYWKHLSANSIFYIFIYVFVCSIPFLYLTTSFSCCSQTLLSEVQMRKHKFLNCKEGLLGSTLPLHLTGLSSSTLFHSHTIKFPFSVAAASCLERKSGKMCCRPWKSVAEKLKRVQSGTFIQVTYLE